MHIIEIVLRIKFRRTGLNVFVGKYPAAGQNHLFIKNKNASNLTAFSWMKPFNGTRFSP